MPRLLTVGNKLNRVVDSIAAIFSCNPDKFYVVTYLLTKHIFTSCLQGKNNSHNNVFL